MLKMRAAQRKMAQPLRARIEHGSRIHPTATSRRSQSTAVGQSEAPSRREPDQDDRDSRREEHVQRSHNEVVSKAITISAVEELQAANRLLRDELRRNRIPVPKAASGKT